MPNKPVASPRTNCILRRLSSILFLTLIVACSDPSVEQQTRLSDTPPADGKCAGWQKSLSKGQRIATVEQCLRNKALENRSAATEEAKKLVQWEIKERSDDSLMVLVTTLLKFPDNASLERYLSAMSLLPNPPDEYSRLDKALTTTDYLVEKGNIHWFDAETGMYPNNHDILLSEVAALSGLKDAVFTETPPEVDEFEGDPYLLTASFRGKSYHQDARNFGDWYDIEAVLMLLNRIANDNALDSRFVTLPTGDQTAIIWAVDNSALNKLQAEGLIKLSDSEISMQTGKAFEAEVKKGFDVNKWKNRGKIDQ